MCERFHVDISGHEVGLFEYTYLDSSCWLATETAKSLIEKYKAMSTQKCTIVTLPEMIRMIEVEVVFISPLNAEHRFLIGYTVSFLPVENFQASPFFCVCV